MQRLEVSGAVRPIYGSLGVKRLRYMALRSTFEFQTLEHEGGSLMMRRRYSTPDATRPRDSAINTLTRIAKTHKQVRKQGLYIFTSRSCTAVVAWENAARIANRYGLNGPEIETRRGGGEIFCSHPDWPWGPPSLP